MKDIRTRIETAFAAWGLWVVHNPFKALLPVLALTFALFAQLPNLSVDTSNEAFFPDDDKALIDYEQFREQFGKDESFVVAIETPDAFSDAFLRKLQRFHSELEATVPYVDEITSLINARNTRGEGDRLIVEDLLEHWPRDDKELATLKTRVLGNPLYLNTLISPDATLVAITVRPLAYLPVAEGDVLAGFDDTVPAADTTQESVSNPQYMEMATAIRQLSEQYQAADFRIHVGGLPALTDALDRSVLETMTTLTPLSYLLSIIFLALLFRRVSGVIYPLLIVMLSSVATIGSMPLLNAELNNLTSIIPSFITVVGIADSVHILAIFYRRYNATGDKQEAISYALGHSGLAILMTSITTAGGLLSFAAAGVEPVAQLGMVTPVGILLAFVYTVVLLPALIALLPMAAPSDKAKKHSDTLDRFLGWVASYSCRHPAKILATSALLVATAFIGISQLQFSHNAMRWFPDGHAIKVSTELLDEKLAGSMLLEIVIDTGTGNGLYEPALLQQLAASIDYVEGLQIQDEAMVGKAWTLDSIVREINQALHESDPQHYSIPNDRALVAQELFLFEGTGSDDLEKVVDADFSQVRFTLKAPFRDAFEYQPMVQAVQQHFEANYPDARISITGEMALLMQVVINIIETMASSYAISLVVISLLMIAMIGQLRTGLLSMIPNLVPLLLVGGLMGALKVPLDFATMLTGSIAIGLVVDDTIHFMHNFRRYFSQSGDVERAIHQTLQTTGRAILVTTVVLAVSFFSYTSVEMKSTAYFGAIIGSVTVLALLADFFMMPALLRLVYRDRDTSTELAPAAAPGDSQ